jgi:hypothetical protein
MVRLATSPALFRSQPDESRTCEKRIGRCLGFAITFVALTLPIRAQTPRILGGEPRDVVEVYWNMGVRGQLLTRQGWERSAANFATPTPTPQDASFDVFSNDYGVNTALVTGNSATVEVGFTNVGHIDAALRFSPPRAPPPGVLETAFAFRLEITPVYNLMYGPDGKTLIEKKPTGNTAWTIAEPKLKPWTTVNTAIRYVLEMHNKTTDPIIKKNADETLAKLLSLH